MLEIVEVSFSIKRAASMNASGSGSEGAVTRRRD
jgi:hypothetical protein